MKTLPENISSHPDGLLVRVQRHKVLFQAFVPASHPAALARAIELRDRFLKNAGPKKKNTIRKPRPNDISRSNTGISGISETVKFTGIRAYPCFNVSWSEHGRQRMKRFTYGNTVDRTAALESAIYHRLKMIKAVYE